MERLRIDMVEISEGQERLKEGQREIRQKFGEIESECRKLKEETMNIAKQSDCNQIRIDLMFSILKARQDNNFSHAERLTQLLRAATVELSVPQRSLPYRQSRFMVNSRYQTSDFPGRNLYSCSKLFNVEIKVQRNYRQQHVPLVSLMSKLNGKAIVGHPLTIENLDDGYSDLMLGSNERDTTHFTGGETPKLGHAAMRNIEAGRTPARRMTVKPRSSPSKSHKLRKCGLLSKKIRKLSSLTGKRVEDSKLVVEKPGGPVIACIPLKLVFSRINEAVNGSARQTHRALPSSNS